MAWQRAYRTGDHVRLEEDGLYFVGRVDDQVKIGGRLRQNRQVVRKTHEHDCLDEGWVSHEIAQARGFGEATVQVWHSAQLAGQAHLADDHGLSRQRLFV